MRDVRLGPTASRVADLVGRGWSNRRIAGALGISAYTVAEHINRIAKQLPDPDAVDPKMRVALWAAHRRWLAGHPIPHIA